MNNVGFYPTTQLNPYTTTIGSQGTFQSIMSYIYGAGVYETVNTDSAETSSSIQEYTGMNLSFTPINSRNALLSYNIYSGGTAGGLPAPTAGIDMMLAIDTNSPPTVGSSPPATITQIDVGALSLDIYRTQTLNFTGGKIWGGANSGIPYTLILNTQYYLTWYFNSQVSGDYATLQLLGMSMQSI